MEEDQEFKHVCKFCNRSFPCGRSLGGHMRSHMTNNNNSAEPDDKLTKKMQMLSSVNTEMGFETGTQTGYGLRENPKKTKRLADSSEDTSLLDKFCKECGRGFQSWKALFGHMKCHSEKEKVSKSNSLEEEEEQESWTSANQKLVMDSQSDNETAPPSRKRRSKRRTRYMATANSSSLSFANNNASSSVSEIDQHEQEEVAMSLMMLSRGVGHWGSGLNSVAESSDNNSVFFEAKIEVKNYVGGNGDGIVKLKKLKEKKLDSAIVCCENFQFEGRQSEFCASEISINGSKMNKTEASIDGLLKNDRIKKSRQESKLGLEDSEIELRKNLIKEAGILNHGQLGGSSKYNSSKKKFRHSYNPELKSDSLKRLTTTALDTEFRKDSHFECNTCSKVFHSYQALGGHRASHKKTKGCFASRIDSSETSFETDLSPDPTADSKPIKPCNSEFPPIDHLVTSHGAKKGKGHDHGKKAETSHGGKKISKGHECPICLKVFPSGQALGGHKRSHLVGASTGTETSNNPKTIVIPKPIPEIRDFLDLNLPAPVEEDSNGHVGFNQWWIGSSHKHEGLVGLISNSVS